MKFKDIYLICVQIDTRRSAAAAAVAAASPLNSDVSNTINYENGIELTPI